jgi:nicotinamide N-methyltransferase
MSILNLVEIPLPSPSTSESELDIFHSAIPNIFTDDTRNQHGDPGSKAIYKSKYGQIALTFAPDNSDETSLFAHYLWNASILMSELISYAHMGPWAVEGKDVIELGAGRFLFLGYLLHS